MEGWERVQLVMNETRHNKNSFSEAIGLSNNVTITRIINEKRKPSKTTFTKIHEAFPQYSIKWLLSGEGPKLNITPIIDPIGLTMGSNNIIANRNFKDINIGTGMPSGTPKKKPSEPLIRENERLLAENKKLLSDNEFLHKSVEDKREVIELLKDKIKDLEEKVRSLPK